MTERTVKDRSRAYRTAQTGQKRHVSVFFAADRQWQCSEACVREGCPCWCHTAPGAIQKIGRSQ